MKLKNSKIAVCIVIVALLLIPVLYSYFYLRAFWDPYNNLSGINVAIVNLDEGENGENLGEELAQKLIDKKLINVSVVYDSDEAQQGLIDKDYYATITVPKNFTQTLNNAENEDRQMAVITYSPNQKSNYIASQILKNVASAIETELRSEVSKEVVATLSDKLNEVPDSLQEISDGSAKLQDGAKQLSSGADTLTEGVSTLGTNYTEFDKGVDSAYLGSSDLSKGLNQLNDGLENLTQGISQLEEATTKIPEIVSATEQLSSGASTLASSVSSYVDGTNSAIKQIEATASNLTTLAANLNAYVASHPEAMQDSNFMQAVGTLQSMNSSSDSLSSLNILKQSGAKLKEGANTLNSGLQTYNSKISGLNALPQAISQLSAGAQQLQNGIASASNGGKSLTSGLKELSSSSKQVANGITTLQNGSQELQQGTQTLLEGTTTFKEEIEDGLENTKEELTALNGLDEYTAEPVSVEEIDYAQVNSYGETFAAFFMSLSLWVGAMILLIILYYDLNDRFKLLGRNAKNKHLRTALYILIGIAQGLILALILQFTLPLEIENLWLYYGSCMLIGATFVSIEQFLIISFDDVGKFICVILLILQLVATGGTFPIETEPAFFQNIYNFMPMSYTIKLFKEIIIFTDSGKILPNIIVIASLFVVFTALTFLKDTKLVQEKIFKRKPKEAN